MLNLFYLLLRLAASPDMQKFFGFLLFFESQLLFQGNLKESQFEREAI